VDPALYEDSRQRPSPSGRRVNTVQWKAADGSMQIRWEPIAPMPQELKDAIAAEGGGKLPEELQ
jgi:succinate dehydrogenase / fumarate reductase flavoprotein subunit